MSIDIQQFHQTFFDESFEGLQIMESGMLQLNRTGDDLDRINKVFRAAHSIKGGSATFGFGDIASFTHQLETLLDEMRSNRRPVTGEAVDLLLRSVDCLREMLKAAQDGTSFDQERMQYLHKEFEQMIRTPAIMPALVMQPDEQPGASSGWRIIFRPYPLLFCTGNDPVLLFRALRDLGELRVETDVRWIPSLSKLNPELCYLSWKLLLLGDVPRERVNEIFEWLEGDCELDIAPLSEGLPIAKTDTAVSLPVEEKPVTIESISQQLPENAAAPNSQEPQLAADRRSGIERRQPETSIRVSIDKIDALINTVGELVITQAMLSQLGESFDINKLDRLRDGLDQLERNTHELQESVLRIRMLPIGFAFNRFPRLVRDLSQKLGKKADLQMTGEQTELDKTVMEKISDPLIHLVRNSLDHGIEAPEARAAAGKPETGIIQLSAYHKGGNIHIEVSDDGAGINRDRLLVKAREIGMAVDEDLTDDNILDLIFLPGISTAESVSDLSGRGVGMDVVRRNIRELQGQIEVHSKEGQGTKILIRLPLTLAILDGQLVRIGKENCIIPLVSICESLQMESSRVSAVAGRSEIYSLRGNHIPIIRPMDVFGLHSTNGNSSGSLLVVVEGDGQRAGIVVDELLGQQQVVIKSLETNFKRVDGISGATILGDGTVALIIDISGLISLSRKDALPTVGRQSIGGNV
jgi:two-component system, chemotaxis family, sensor kinase CheA